MKTSISIKISNKSCLHLAFFNACLSLVALLLEQEYAPIRLIALISFASFMILLWNKLDNILLLARTLFLGGIGYFPMLIKTMFGPTTFFSAYERSTQGFDIVILMYVATSLAIFGNEIGLNLGARHAGGVQKVENVEESSLWRTIFYVSIPVVLWASYESIVSLGPMVFLATYASETKNMVLGNSVGLGIICLLAMFVAYLKCGRRYDLPIIIALTVFFLIYSLFLRGSRQDVLTALFGMLVCFSLAKRQTFAVTRKFVFFVLIVFILFELWGTARLLIATNKYSLKDVVDIVMTNSTNAADAIQFGTVSGIATTFSNMVWLIENERVELAWGRSYWEYILRSPPAFLYPDRPTDYAWIFQDYNLEAGGGFFEIGEAYMNLGLVGALLFPAIVSYLMARSFFNALKKQTAFSYFLLFSFLGVFFRGTWYQTFGFYKLFLTVMIFYPAVLIIHKVIRRRGYPGYRF